jgi:hypothetical protein
LNTGSRSTLSTISHESVAGSYRSMVRICSSFVVRPPRI